jgi:hypothetical protein
MDFFFMYCRSLFAKKYQSYFSIELEKANKLIWRAVLINSKNMKTRFLSNKKNEFGGGELKN